MVNINKFLGSNAKRLNFFKGLGFNTFEEGKQYVIKNKLNDRRITDVNLKIKIEMKLEEEKKGKEKATRKRVGKKEEAKKETIYAKLAELKALIGNNKEMINTIAIMEKKYLPKKIKKAGPPIDYQKFLENAKNQVVTLNNKLDVNKDKANHLYDKYYTHGQNIDKLMVKSFYKTAANYFIIPETLGSSKDLINFWNKYKHIAGRIVNESITKYNGVRVSFVLKVVVMIEIKGPDVTENYVRRETKLFTSDVDILKSSFKSHIKINQLWDSCLLAFEKMEAAGSGWKLESIDGLYVNVWKYKPIGTGSYIELPEQIAASQACVNVKNTDNKCFLWSILSADFPVKSKNHPNRVTNYTRHEDTLNMEGIVYPVTIHSFSLFEYNNNRNINVFRLVDNKICPYYMSKNQVNPTNLLIYDNKTSGISHCVWIKSITRLLNHTNVSSYTGNNNNNTKHWCLNCIQCFGSDELLTKHHDESKCFALNKGRVVLPKDGEHKISYKRIEYELRYPFVVYADFEALTVPFVDGKEDEAKTHAYQKHDCISYGYKVVSTQPEHTSEYKSFRSSKKTDDACLNFLQDMAEVYKKAKKLLQKNVPLLFTTDEYNQYLKTTKCYICNGDVDEFGDNRRVADHDHFTGKFRGAAHNNCNIKFTVAKTFKLPVFFHNLRGYDSHFIIRKMTQIAEKIDVIPLNMEKYMSITMDNHIQFKDSMQFLNSSLSNLVKSVPKESFTHLMSDFKGCSKNQLDLIIQKGVFPYDWFNNLNCLKETKLPSKDKFFSKLSNDHITDKEYKLAQNVWKAFNMNSFGEYHDLYLKTDVCLLADVFEFFRTKCIDIYKIDPAHFISLPSTSWQCMLRHTGQTIESFKEGQIDMQLMVESGLRGGISMISQRYAVANNKYMSTGYDKNKPSSYIMYLDANALYGHAMTQPLPYGEYAWEKDISIWNKDKILNLSDDDETGYIFKVDLTYPKELHDLHNDYPLAPESCVGDESPFMANIRSEIGNKRCKIPKLIPNLNNKKEYVVHYRNLKFYINHGLILTKIHSVMSFKQSLWMKKFIDTNTNERKASKTDFEKDLWKLMSNAIFGKTMENVRNRTEVEICGGAKGARRIEKISRKPNVKHWKLLGEEQSTWSIRNNRKNDTVKVEECDTMIVEMERVETKLNKPIAIGFSVLELSKIHMYEFHYDVIKKKYGDNARLLFTDTDSLCYQIFTDDLYEDMKKDSHLYDFSAYPKTHPCYDETNKKITGKFKDETNGLPVLEFVGLRSKMYSLLIDTDDDKKKEKKTGKGIQKAYLKQKVKHIQYKQSLFGKTKKDIQHLADFNLIRSSEHQLYSLNVKKVSLCSYDDKRFVKNDGHTCFSHGHYRIPAYIDKHCM